MPLYDAEFGVCSGIGTSCITGTILCAFAKLQEETINFVVSVCPLGTTRLPLEGFS
jgi:hypothetical protein